MKVFVVKLNAGHDTNGNPRRVFVIHNSDGVVIDVIDEGYSGDAKVNKKYKDFWHSKYQFDITAKEYKSLLKLFKFQKKHKDYHQPFQNIFEK